MSARLRLGTRGSRLARWQADWVARRLQQVHPGLDVELTEIRTPGDAAPNQPLHAFGGTGAFTRGIDQALLAGAIDLAVHSLKDLPTQIVAGAVLAATPLRGDPRDALISRNGQTLRELPRHATAATGSPRRKAQLLALRPGLKVIGLRGNVENRILQLHESASVDAIVLAAAGLERLGLMDEVTEMLSIDTWLPAPGQAALGVTVRQEDRTTIEKVQAIEDGQVRAAVEAERAFLSACNGGCHAPIGAYAQPTAQGLTLHALIAAEDGSRLVRGHETGPSDEPAERGQRLAARLLTEGGSAILESQ